jgi:hypothetical protein
MTPNFNLGVSRKVNNLPSSIASRKSIALPLTSISCPIKKSMVIEFLAWIILMNVFA